MLKAKIDQLVPAKEGTLTERGEKIYRSLDITLKFPDGGEFKRVIQPDHQAIGFTEEWIEDTIAGCLKNLELDFPQDIYQVVRLRPNQIEFHYAGSKGRVN
jgi:hypothetical protein